MVVNPILFMENAHMRFKTLLIAALIVSLGGMAFAELQNVELGGSIRIRGNYFNMDSLRDSSYVEQRTRLNVKADSTQPSPRSSNSTPTASGAKDFAPTT